MFKRFKVAIVVCLLITIFAGTASAYTASYTVVVSDNDVESRYVTTATTVSELFDENSIAIGSKDKITVDIDENLYSGMDIKIKRGFFVKVINDEIIEKIEVDSDSKVGNLIADLSERDNKEYIYTGGTMADSLYKDKVVIIHTKRIENAIETNTIPFETEKTDDNTILQGKEVVAVEGKEGIRTITSEVVYIDDVEESRRVVGDSITQEVVNKVIKVGTKKEEVKVAPVADTSVVEVDDSKLTNRRVMQATSYTIKGRTATGTQTRRGVVAVDPRVIPLGSKLYIEGYGFATAEDTGGAIKGNIIDIYLDTYQEAINFGRRNVVVYDVIN